MDLLVKFSLAFLVIHGSHSATVGEYKSYENYKIFTIPNRDGAKTLIQKMMELDDSFVYTGNKTEIQMLVDPNLVPQFTSMANKLYINPELIIDDYSEIIAEERIVPLGNRYKKFSWKAYYDIDDIYGYLREMNKEYSDSTELIVAGYSYEGREILGLKIYSPDGKNEEKPIMFIESGIHAREWITPATTTYFINELLTNDNPEIAAMRDEYEWHIFPSVNPDGYQFSRKFDRMWRKTRSKSPGTTCRGADPNRNWDYNWGESGSSNKPCDYQIYAGSEPFSEAETRSLANYVSNLENLLGYIAFHADAQMLLVPYSDSVEHRDNYDDLIQIGQTSLGYGYKVNEEKYGGPGTAAEILYPVSGGSMDWVKHALGTPLVYTYELRGMNFYWPPWRISEQGDEVTQMMLGLVKEAQNLGYPYYSSFDSK